MQRFSAVSTTDTPIFNANNDVLIFGRLVDVACKVLGYKGKIEYVGPGDDLWYEAMNISVVCKKDKAQRELGWEPKFFLENETNLFVRAWEAGITKREITKL